MVLRLQYLALLNWFQASAKKCPRFVCVTEMGDRDHLEDSGTCKNEATISYYCLVPVRLSSRPLRTIYFGGASETNSPEWATLFASDHVTQKRLTEAKYIGPRN